MSNTAARELTLAEIARGSGVQSKAFLEYTRLLGMAMTLQDLHKSLMDGASIIPTKEYRFNLPPEMNIYEFMLKLKSKLDAVDGKFDYKLGKE
jgi:hypothetical protein